MRYWSEVVHSIWVTMMLNQKKFITAPNTATALYKAVKVGVGGK